MKKAFLAVNAVMLVMILALDVAYMTLGGLGLKAVTSCMFVLTGLLNLLYSIKAGANRIYPVWMAVALIFAMLGDVLLGVNFYLGTAVFGIGHIFYFVSYCTLVRFNRRDFICGACIFLVALGIILFVPFLDFGGALMQGVCCAYALIISFMVGKAVSNFLGNRNAFTVIVAVGSILFFISDLMLVLDRFGTIPNAGYFCLGTYYPAQFLLAFSIFSYVGLKQGKGGSKGAGYERTDGTV